MTRSVALTGASGLIGARLRAALRARGEHVISLARDPSGDAEARAWRPDAPSLDAAVLEGADALVHLAGEPIAGRWTAARKRRIRESRAHGTRVLCEAAARAKRPPDVIVVASAVGYYGDRGDAPLDEGSGPGEGFLAEVCQAWEAAAEPARAAGIRVAHARLGLVLAREGGALAPQLPLFRLGLGARIGSGRQYMSWIAIDDAVSALQHALDTPALVGPFNVVAPDPVTNAEFTRALARVLSRPAFLFLPAPLLRLGLGEMAHELLLSSARVSPRRLEASGFEFRHPKLEAALREILRR